MSDLYHSQFGQDEFLDKYVFKGARDLFFVEIGSADPVNINNTFYFETHKGWRGLLIEARPEACKNLVKHRSSEVINSCLSNQKGRSIFLDYGYLAGLCKFMSMKEHEYIEEYNSRDDHVRAYWVATEPLSGILECRKIQRINLLAIDVEGAEVSVLETIDFSSVFIDVILVECNMESAAKAVEKVLVENGFSRSRVLGADHLYINAESCYR